MSQRSYDFYFSESGGCECQVATRPVRTVEGGWPARGVVFDDAGVTVGYTRCRPVHDGQGPEVRSGEHTLAFPTRGLFRMHMSDRSWLCDPNCVILQNATDVFRTSHPGAIGDETIWITFDHDLLVDVGRGVDPKIGGRGAMPFPTTVALCDSETFLKVRAMLNEACRGPEAEHELIHDSARQVLQAVLASAHKAVASHRPSPRQATERAHAEAAENAKAYMASRLHERITIDQVAKSVHTSPFHLCRLFRKQTGLPIHKYLNRLRLRSAIDRLQHHRSDLARLAVDLGFASHSHFCDAFRREFGAPPSVVRDRIMDLRSTASVTPNNRPAAA